MSDSHEAIGNFWHWLQENQTRLDTLGNPGSAFQSDLTGHLHQLHAGLAFDLPAQSPGKPRELVITAGGKAELFPLVDELVAAAPAVPGWKFTALKPPFGFAFTTSHNGTRFEPQAMWFLSLEDESPDGKLAIRVGIPNFTSTSPTHARAAVAIVLETAIGERSLGLDIASFDVVQIPRLPEPAGYIELFELPDIIEERKAAKA